MAAIISGQTVYFQALFHIISLQGACLPQMGGGVTWVWVGVVGRVLQNFNVFAITDPDHLFQEEWNIIMDQHHVN